MEDSGRRTIVTGAMEPLGVLGEPLATWKGDEIRPTGGLVEVLVVGLPTLFREGVRGILDAEPDLLVIGEVNYAEAVAILTTTSHTPVVLIDIDGLGAEPVAMIHRIQTAQPRAHVMVLSERGDLHLVRHLLSLGVSAYLLKSVTGKELVSAVRGADADHGRVTLSVSRGTFGVSRGAIDTDAGYAPPALSPREHDVLQLAAEAFSNAQIAHRLGISDGTVKRNLRNIFAKLGAVSRIDAVNKGIAASIIPAPRAWLERPTDR
jgi:DNA-binding NarL/FixJ family response regulator